MSFKPQILIIFIEAYPFSLNVPKPPQALYIQQAIKETLQDTYELQLIKRD